MGNYNVSVNMKQRTVKLPDLINRKTLRIKIDGKEAHVALIENICYDKPFFVKVGGKLYRVELDRIGVNDITTVRIDGVPYSVQLENRNRVVTKAATKTLPVARKNRARTLVLDKGAITASLPGKVVLLRVKVGQAVHVGDVLLVLESMKMENEIASPKSGIVKEVKVSEGSAVNIGEIMVVVSET